MYRTKDYANLKRFLNKAIVTKLMESATKILETFDRMLFQLTSVLGEWNSPGNLTLEAETEMCTVWFGTEKTQLEFGLMRDWYMAVPHAVIQTVFDASQKRYKKIVGNRDQYRKDAEDVYNGEQDYSNNRCDGDINIDIMSTDKTVRLASIRKALKILGPYQQIAILLYSKEDSEKAEEMLNTVKELLEKRTTTIKFGKGRGM